MYAVLTWSKKNTFFHQYAVCWSKKQKLKFYISITTYFYWKSSTSIYCFAADLPQAARPWRVAARRSRID